MLYKEILDFSKLGREKKIGSTNREVLKLLCLTEGRESTFVRVTKSFSLLLWLKKSRARVSQILLYVLLKMLAKERRLMKQNEHIPNTYQRLKVQALNKSEQFNFL